MIAARIGGGVDLRVSPGELVGLVGPNGAGKSTLMRAALGLVPASGHRALGDTPLAELPPAARALRAAYLPQSREIGWPVTVEVLVSLGRAPHRALAQPLTAADRLAVENAMQRMDVAKFRDVAATRMSGGEQARVLIARALAQDAPLMLADEPTAGLDPAHQIAVMESFADMAREGRGVVVSLHDLGLAARWCTRLVLLDQGRIAADGAPRDVLTAERLRSVYGIDAHLAEAAGALIVQPLSRVARDGEPLQPHFGGRDRGQRAGIPAGAGRSEDTHGGGKHG